MQEWSGLCLLYLLVAGHAFVLVFCELNVAHLEDYGVEALSKFFELNCAVTLAFNPSDNGNELLITGIETVLFEEAIQVEVGDGALALAVK